MSNVSRTCVILPLPHPNHLFFTLLVACHLFSSHSFPLSYPLPSPNPNPISSICKPQMAISILSSIQYSQPLLPFNTFQFSMLILMLTAWFMINWLYITCTCFEKKSDFGMKVFVWLKSLLDTCNLWSSLVNFDFTSSP